jgi:hypothetical protein
MYRKPPAKRGIKFTQTIASPCYGIVAVVFGYGSFASDGKAETASSARL